MASRPLIPPHKVVDAGDMSDDITSDVTVIQNITRIGYQVVWSAGSTPVGTVTVEVSNDYSQNGDGSERNAGSWTAVAGISASVSGNSGNGYIDIADISAYAIRLVYTRASGSGTLDVTICAKVA